MSSRPEDRSIRTGGIEISRVANNQVATNMAMESNGFHQRNRGARKNSWYSRCTIGRADGFAGRQSGGGDGVSHTPSGCPFCGGIGPLA